MLEAYQIMLKINADLSIYPLSNWIRTEEDTEYRSSMGRLPITTIRYTHPRGDYSVVCNPGSAIFQPEASINLPALDNLLNGYDKRNLFKLFNFPPTTTLDPAITAFLQR